MTTYAYARVSARDQNLTRQLEAFRAYGVEKKNTFCDKKSGKDFDRTNYLRLIKKMRKGDLLVVQSIDRLGRNYNLIIEEWSRITKKIGANILVLDMPILDTRDKGDSLIGKFISDVVLQVLSFVAENERENIKARQAAGINAAKEKGIKFGRPEKSLSDEFLQAAWDFTLHKQTLKILSARFSMKPSTFYYHTRKIFPRKR